MKINEIVKENASMGGTSSGAIATVIPTRKKTEESGDAVQDAVWKMDDKKKAEAKAKRAKEKKSQKENLENTILRR